MLASFLDRDDVLETSWVRWFGSDLSVDLNESLHENGFDFTSIQSILEPVSQENDEGKAFA